MPAKPLNVLNRWLQPQIDRRRFLQASAALAGTAAAGSVLLKARDAEASTPDPVDSDANVAVVYSTCQMCHGRCGLMAKVDKVSGVLLKLDGNPYNAQNMDPDEQVPPTVPADGSHNGVPVKHIRGRMCPRGQAGVQTLYNPYRLTTPLKRAGARGAGRWVPISWNTALTEIAAKIDTLIPYATRNSADIVPGLPELGKVANGLTISPGRTLEGILWERVFKLGYGTVNWRLDHTSICEASHHIACRLASTGTSTSGKSHYHADHPNCKYAVLIGANPLEANFAMVPLARSIMNMKANGGKLVVVDPRFSNTATKADKWLPVKPGGDGAFAMGLARHIIENDLHIAAPRDKYLFNANKKAATDEGEPTYSDATWLVVVQDGPDKGKLINPTIADGAGGTTNRYCWTSGNTALAFDPASTTTAAAGVLTPGIVTVGTNNVQCKTVFELYKEQVYQRTVAGWALLCGLSASDIVEVANGLTDPANGRATAIWSYRGAVQHTNGTMAEFAVQAVVTMLGNIDYRGGQTAAAGGSNETSASSPGVNLKAFGTGVTAQNPVGPRLDRAGAAYSSFPNLAGRDGYPALRPWFPFAALGTYQEIIPAIADQYPYPTKVLITYWNAFPYSVPALKKVFEETVSDENKLPLFVAIDPIIGENSAWADYILPDTTYLEKWSLPHGGYASELTKNNPLQQPVVGKLKAADNTMKIIGSVPFDPAAPNDFESYLGPNGPRMVMDIIIDLAKKLKKSDGSLGLSGVGPNAFTNGGACEKAWDLAQMMITNFAVNLSTTLPDVVAKGGSFQTFDTNAYTDSLDTGVTGTPTGKYLRASRYGKDRHLYAEVLVTTKNWFEDKPYYDFGTPRWEAPAHMDGTPVNDAGYPFKVVTYKTVLHGQARTHVNPWLMAIEAENGVVMSSADARSLGVETGDSVRLVSASSPSSVVGKAIVTEGIRPGVVAVSHSFGHWEGGARPQVIEGNNWFTPNRQEGWRGGGITINPILRTDNMFPNVSLQDRLGGSVSFYDTHVAIEKVIL